MSSNKQCRKGRSLKRWVVVIFTQTKDFSVVPINWLNLDFDLEDLNLSNISSVKYCRWPPFKVTSLELMNADDIEETWQLFKIKVMDDKIYVNFKQAWHKQVEIEFSTTESEQEAPRKKMKCIQNTSSKSLFDLSDESNEYDDNNFYNVLASSQTQTVAAPVTAVRIGTIASPSFSPADYMHNVCLGVTKRLIEFWVKGKKDVRLIEENKVRITNNLLNLRQYVPSEFSRLPRGLDDIEYYKATELRMFVIHSGLIVLKGNLSKQMYSHFKLLVCALRILITPDICQTLNNLAQSLLNEFVSQYSSLYGAHFVGYNVHSLLHLPMFVKVHGCLDNFSCFKYENYLQYIKKSVKSAKYPLQKVTNRIMEKQKYFISSNIKLDPIVIVKEIVNTTSSPFFCLDDRLFKQIFIKELKVTINIHNKRDKYIMLNNNDIVIVNNIVKPKNKLGFNLIVQTFLDTSSLFNEPIVSSTIGLHTVNPIILSENFTISISDIKYKCFFIYLSHDKAIITTLNHSFIDKSY